MAKKLSPQQRLFVCEYMKDLNASQAAVRAGYAKSSCRSIASKLLTKDNIQKAISALMARRAKRCEVSADRVVRELARVSFSDLTHFISWNEGATSLLPSDSLSLSKRRALKEVVEDVDSEGAGTIRVKLHDKVKALDLLGRHLGIFKPQEVKHAGQIEVVITDYRTKKK